MHNFLHFHQEEELSINITSMIDVIFILLIFFMVSTQFKKSSIPLDLPKTEDTVNEDEDKNTKVLAVNANSIELEGILISIDELKPRLEKMYQENPDIAISLECEKTLEFERVVQILTKVQEAGILKIGIIHDSLDL